MPEFYIKDGELYHWKYISKKRVNGKWRYVYDTKKAADAAKAAYETSKKDFDSALDDLKKAEEGRGLNDLIVNSPDKLSKMTDEEINDHIERADKRYEAALDRATESGKIFATAHAEYAKATKVSKMKKAAASVVGYVAKLALKFALPKKRKK